MKHVILKSSLILIGSIVLFGSIKTNAQGQAIHYQLPFLLLDESARVAGFGSVNSVANEYYTDAGSWSNPALLSRNKKTMGASFNYSPWKKEEVIYSQLNGNVFYSLNDKNVLALHFKSFNGGSEDDYFSYDGQWTYLKNSNDYNDKVLKLSYAHHFKKGFSAGGSFSYLNAGVTGSASQNYRQVSSSLFAFGFGFNYDRLLFQIESFKLPLSIGFCANNLGPSIAYVDRYGKDFYPAIVGLGIMLSPSYQINEKNRITLDMAYQAEKLLIPSPSPLLYRGPKMESGTTLVEYYFRSFHDAYRGWNEELEEIIHAYGTEIRWERGEYFALAMRGGLHKENIYKGNLKYFTLGAGVSVYGFSMNYSWYLNHKNYDGLVFPDDSYMDMSYYEEMKIWFLQIGYTYKFQQ